MKKILFVCLGNICRSPAAEGVFLSIIEKKSQSQNFLIDSAGTSAHHVGEKADSRMIEHAKRRGIELLSRSRKLVYEDFEKFDYILAMDDSNYNNILRLDDSGKFHKKVFKMMSFCHSFEESEVPDPYYGGAAGFEKVLDILEEGLEEFYNKLIANDI